MGRPSRPGMAGSPSGPGGGLHDEPTFNDHYGAYASPSSGPGVNTRPYGPAPGTLPRSPATGRPSNPYGVPERPSQRKGNGPLIGVIVAATVLLLGLSCFLIVTLSGNAFGHFFGDSPTATLQPTVAMTTVPNFVDVQLTVAQAQAQAFNLIIDTNADVTYKTDPTKPKNVIMAQDPAAHTQQPWGTHIKVTVSGGPGQTKVPNVVGKTMSLGRSIATRSPCSTPPRSRSKRQSRSRRHLCHQTT
jgi:hypothetical protein